MKEKIQSRLQELQKEYDNLSNQRSQLSNQLTQVNNRMIAIEGAFGELSSFLEQIEKSDSSSNSKEEAVSDETVTKG